MKREPFPLQWPEGWKRTKQGHRQRSKFGFRSSGQVSFSNARGDLLLELDRLGAANVIITSDLPTRNDGLPYPHSVRLGLRIIGEVENESRAEGAAS